MIGVNRVYQKVQAIANKEQRGYITPEEFNLFADYAQHEIFEQYFYDLEQRKRGIGNENDYEIISNIEEKIATFEVYNSELAFLQPSFESWGVLLYGTAIYRLGSVKPVYSNGVKTKAADKVMLNEIHKYENSPLGAPTESNPIYAEMAGSSTSVPLGPAQSYVAYFKVFPVPASVIIDFIRYPQQPRWTYIISSTGNALYNSSLDTVNFELHRSEENNLVTKILQLAGVSIKDLSLAQAAAQEEAKGIQLEKQ